MRQTPKPWRISRRRIASRYVTGLSDRGSRETPRPERSWTQWLLQSFVFVAICGLGLLVSLRLGIVVAVLLLGYLFVQPTRKVDEVA